MTLGQRIAQKRRELGLSQEALGEQLGVSRQAIYKWESDASLPEIEKLITLSKIFSVPVGWLLGLEEERENIPSQESGELTETQLQMVQEIADRYQAAQPRPQRSAWDKWSVRILFAMCGIMLALLVGTNGKIKDMEQQYAYIANSVGEVSYSVDRQINSITSRVEDILKSQNSLTAEWSADLVSIDPSNDLATFYVRVVPKTYVEGMTALFQAHSGDEGTVWVPVEPGEDHAFSGQVTCPLSDEIDVSVILITGDKRETQWLNGFYGLYSGTFPDLTLVNRLWSEGRKDGVLPAQLPAEQNRGSGTTVRYLNENEHYYIEGWNPSPPETIQVGLFRDRKLVLWYQGGVEDVQVNNALQEQYVWRRPKAVTLEPGHTYHEAAVYTDKYGRQRIYSDWGLYCELNQYGDPIATYEADYIGSGGTASWEF